MSMFYQAKVYRSRVGCCICKAKSSTSRFTASEKYEDCFLKCFLLTTLRQGEICNACVLIVKRFKKLPKGSLQNWEHVVDVKSKPRLKKRIRMRRKPCVNINNNVLEGSLSGEEVAKFEQLTIVSGAVVQSRKRKNRVPIKNHVNEVHGTSFINRTIWKKCIDPCGDAWRNKYGQTVLDISNHNYWANHILAIENKTKLKSCQGLITSSSSTDNSSDSGFDDLGILFI